MSKFRIKVELQGLKIEVEGSREDVHLAERVGKQFGNLITPALLVESNLQNRNGSEASGTSDESDKGRSRKKKTGTVTGKTSADEINISADPSKYGSPTQEWTAVQKAIWFLHVVQESGVAKELTGYAIAKNFNKHFKAAGTIVGGNVSTGLDREKLKGKDAPVGADMSGGTAKYFLTQAGEELAKRLVQGEAASGE